MNRHVIRLARRRQLEIARTWAAALLMAWFMGLFLGRAHAQDAGTVTQTCGTIAQQYPVGATRPFQVDVNGNQCTTGNSLGAGAGNAGFVSNATPVNAFATGTTLATTATLAASATQFTYICGFHVEPGSATAAVTVNVTITGLKGGTFTTAVNAPVTATTATAGPIASQTFSPCLPSSAINTAIAVTASALGTGGVNQNVNAWGFQQ